MCNVKFLVSQKAGGWEAFAFLGLVLTIRMK